MSAERKRVNIPLERWRKRTKLGLRHAQRSGHEMKQATETLAPILLPALAILTSTAVRRILSEKHKREINIELLNQQDLLELVLWAYSVTPRDLSPGDLSSCDTSRLDNVTWQYRHPNPKDIALWPKKMQLLYDDLAAILMMMWEPETQKHLQPLIGIRSNGETDVREPHWHNPSEVTHGVSELAMFYTCQGEMDNITTLVARDHYQVPRGALSIRWRGYNYLPQDEERLAILEKGVVDFEFRRRGIFSKLLDRALSEAYQNHDYRQVTSWVLTDSQADNFSPIFRILVGRGFYPQILWSQLAEQYQADTGGREGFLMVHHRNQFVPTR